MGTRPIILCSVGGNPVHAAFYDRLISATITDNAGQESDTVDLVFDDAGNEIEMPAKGSKISVSFGFQDQASSMMGEFVVEKPSFSFGEDGERLMLTGQSANLRAELKEQGNENYDRMTIGQIVEQLAKRHNYDAKISPELAAKKIEYIARVGQSPMDFLTRLADRNRAQFSIKSNKLLFLSRGILPTITIDKSMCRSGSFEVEPRSKFASIEASYFDRKQGKTEKVNHETGLTGPVRRLRTVYNSKDEAEAAAGSEGDRLGRATGSGTLEMGGRPDVMADTPLNLTGFRHEANGPWRAGTVTHQFDESGYITSVELEAPESGKE